MTHTGGGGAAATASRAVSAVTRTEWSKVVALAERPACVIEAEVIELLGADRGADGSLRTACAKLRRDLAGGTVIDSSKSSSGVKARGTETRTSTGRSDVGLLFLRTNSFSSRRPMPSSLVFLLTGPCPSEAPGVSEPPSQAKDLEKCLAGLRLH